MLSLFCSALLFNLCKSQVTDPLTGWTPTPSPSPLSMSYAGSTFFTAYQSSANKIWLIGDEFERIMAYTIGGSWQSYPAFSGSLQLGTINSQCSCQWNDTSILFANAGRIRQFSWESTPGLTPFNSAPDYLREAPCLTAVNPDWIFATGGMIITTDAEGAAGQESRYLQMFENGVGWSNGPNMKLGRGQHACVIHNNYLYAFGGAYMSGSTQYAQLSSERLYIGNMASLGSWSNIAYNSNSNVYYHRAVVHSLYNHIYLVGGRDSWSGDASQNIQIYDPATDTLELVDSSRRLNTGRSSPAVIAVANKIYVFGGTNTAGTETYKSCEVSNTLTFSPTPSPTLPTQIPTKSPTRHPTEPTKNPTIDPTIPTIDPTLDPSKDQTTDPTADPTADPTMDPTFDPTFEPTFDPTFEPTSGPSSKPTQRPSNIPSKSPITTPPPARNPNSAVYCIPLLLTISDLVGVDTNDYIIDSKLQQFVVSNTKSIIYNIMSDSFFIFDIHTLCDDFWNCFYLELRGITGDTEIQLNVCSYAMDVYDALYAIIKSNNYRDEMAAYMISQFEFYFNGAQYNGYDNVNLDSLSVSFTIQTTTTTTTAPTGDGAVADVTVTNTDSSDQQTIKNDKSSGYTATVIVVVLMSLLVILGGFGAVVVYKCSKRKNTKAIMEQIGGKSVPMQRIHSDEGMSANSSGDNVQRHDVNGMEIVGHIVVTPESFINADNNIINSIAPVVNHIDAAQDAQENVGCDEERGRKATLGGVGNTVYL